MFFLLLFLAFALWFGVSAIINKLSRTDMTGGYIGSAAFGICTLVAAVITMPIMYSSYVGSQENIVCNNQQKKIFIEKRNDLQSKYTVLLDSTYSKYEGDIYDKMTDKNKATTTNVNIYPAPQYSQTIIELTKQIASLNDVIYGCDINITNEEKSMRTMKRSIFTFNCFLPD